MQNIAPEMNSADIKGLLTIIEQQLNWGEAVTWQTKDFENLNELIFEKTKVSLSPSTLKRVWGRVEYNHLPSGTTLDTLARFAGFDNWRAFLKAKAPSGKTLQTQDRPAKKAHIYSAAFLTVAGLLFVIVLIGLVGFYKATKAGIHIRTADYQFSSQRLAKGIPNTVIFNYDASKSPVDSVYIQQSWDPRTTTLVSRALHQHTSVYYEPGFYQARLVIGHKVVREHKLIIPTEGWLGLIENKPVPVYLDSADFVFKDKLRLPASAILKKKCKHAAAASRHFLL